jgi:MFS transporter, DHA2 family, multidrug resistance protein
VVVDRSVRTPTRSWWALALLSLPVLLTGIDNTILAFAIPAITERFRPSATTQLWIVDIYSLLLAALLVVAGALGDRIGRRRCLLIGCTGFSIASAVAAFAPSAEILVAVRGVLGVFGALLMPCCLSLLRNIFDLPSARRLAIAIWASCFTVGTTAGPIVGGVLLEHFYWGAVFLVAVPVLAPVLLLAHRLVPESKDPNPGPVDLLSVAMCLITMLPLVWAVKTAAHDGFSPYVVVALVVASVTGYLFVRRQHRSDFPMLDVDLFRHGPFTASIVTNFMSVVGLVGFLFFIAQHLQLVLGMAPLAAGLVTLPGATASVIAGLAAVPLAKRFSARTLLIASMTPMCVGYLVLFAVPHHLTVPVVIGVSIALKVGIGLSQTISSDTVLSSVSPDKAGSASAMSETAYELGAVVGTAVLGTIITAYYRVNVVLPPKLSAEQRTDARESIGGAMSVVPELPSHTAQQLTESARHAFDSGIGPAGLVAAACCLVAMTIVRIVFTRTRR